MFPLQENQYSFILLARECGLGLQRVSVLHCSDLWQLTLKNLASGWNQSQLVLYPGFLYGTWRKAVEERNHGGGSTLNKKLTNLFTVKGQWHLCDWSHSDQGFSAKESCEMLGLCLLCPTSRYYDCYWKTGRWTMCLCLSHYNASSGLLS